MDPTTLLTLYDYSCWATDRVLSACRRAGEREFTAPRPELYYGSLRNTLVHMLSAEWICRLQQHHQQNELSRERRMGRSVDRRWRARGDDPLHSRDLCTDSYGCSKRCPLCYGFWCKFLCGYNFGHYGQLGGRRK